MKYSFTLFKSRLIRKRQQDSRMTVDDRSAHVPSFVFVLDILNKAISHRKITG